MKKCICLSLVVTIFLSGCFTKSPEVSQSISESSTEEILEISKETSTAALNESMSEETFADDFYNDQTRFEELDGKTKAEYRDYLKEHYAIHYYVFDEAKVKKDLESIDNKTDLGEYLYDNFIWLDMPEDGANPPTHEERIMFIICYSGYIVTPHAYWSSEFKDDWYKRHPEYNIEQTVETGFIDEDIWNNFSLDEAKEHVYKVLKANVDKSNNYKDETYNPEEDEAYIKSLIEDYLKSDEELEKEAEELGKSLQEEVDAIYAKQEADKQAYISEYFIKDDKKYEALHGMTKAEYKDWWLKNRAPERAVFDGEALLEELELIKDKEGLGELLYDKMLISYAETDMVNVITTKEIKIRYLIYESGYINLPNAGYADSDAEFFQLLEEYDKLHIPANGFITMEDWNNFSLDEAKEHVYKVMEHNYKSYNENQLYESIRDDEYLIEIIDYAINH